MMKTITGVLLSPGLTGFYFDDQKAIRNNATGDGFTYRGRTQTPGFSSVRQAGESVSVILIIDDGQVAYGDCAAVQYSGTGGRDPLFLVEEFIPVIRDNIAPLLVGEKLDSFQRLAGKIDELGIHTALRYGITQAVLDAVAKARHISRTEVVAEEYNLELQALPVPILAQSGDDRYLNAEKMIIKRVDILPHGLINNVMTKLGERGEKLLDYACWLKKRIRELGSEDYQPIIHLDVYGTIGQAFSGDRKAIVDYLARLKEAVEPLKLRIEGPVDMGSREGQMEELKALRLRLKKDGIRVELVADEWCNTLQDIKEFADREVADMIQIKTPDLGGINNTIEAVLYCREKGIGAYQGGTCNETDRSAQICTDIALAARPDQILAKPGMGVDEGLMIVNNEMQRVLTLLQAREKKEKEKKPDIIKY